MSLHSSSIRSATKGKREEARGVSGTRSSPPAYQKLRMTMPAAYVTLQQKRSLLISDRLAILSNLTQYPHRINIGHAVREHLSFTACIIAIALYNGDLSPLFCQNFYSSDTEREIRAPRPVSWLPREEYSINDMLTVAGMPTHSFLGAHIPTGDRCLVLDGKATIKGVLWEIVPCHAFAILRDKVRELQQSAEPGAGQLLLRQLVDQCFKLGRRDLLELIVTTAIPRQLTSPAEIFELIDELEASFHGKISWPAHIAEKPNSHVVRTGAARPRATGPKDFLPSSPWGNYLMQWIYHSISNDVPLALGKCTIGEEEEEETHVSIFTFDPAEHHTVFTPLSELDYEFGANPWVHLEPKSSFWCVSVCNAKISDANMQRARREHCVEGDEDDLYISNQILKIERSSGIREMRAIWSPRLSRAGTHKRDPETKSWERVPLGRGMYENPKSEVPRVKKRKRFPS